MADQTPPGPTPSGRIAGVIALVALVLGGYYAVVARPVPSGNEAAAPAETAAAPSSEAPAETQASAPASSDTATESAKVADQEGSAPAADDKSATTAANPPEGAADAAKTAESAPAEAPAAKAEAPASTAPSFDVVRVEPSGEAVAAGLAEPKSTVELLDGAAPIAEGAANDRGEWAIVVEKPLAPGTHDLSIRTTSADKKTQTLSEQRVAIEVPQPGKGDALVVLNEPDAPSRVMQLPAASEPAQSKVADAGQTATSGETNSAAAPSGDTANDNMATADSNDTSGEAQMAAAPTDGKTAAGAGTPPADAGAAPDQTAMAETKPEAGSQEAGASTEAMAAAETPANGQPASDADAKSADAGLAGGKMADGTSAGKMPADGTPAGTEPGAIAGAEPAPDDKMSGETVASADAAATKTEPASEAAPAVEPKVTVDAVEFENGTIYIAGSAAIGGTVRLYVDGVAVGDAQTDANGRWLLETKHDMSAGQHTVRADQVDKATGNVVMRAEVPFEKTVDVAVLAPVATGGGSADGASATGDIPSPQSVIIRRGDNLWTISRRLYGRGIRYSTIYEANADQIRNPHWIYPGQVFVLPAGDARWTN